MKALFSNTRMKFSKPKLGRIGFSLIASLAVLLSVAGCSKRYHNLPAFWAFPVSDPANQSVGRFKTAYLADQIHAYFRGSASGPIAVTTFVDIDNLYQSSTFGRVVGEQLMSELAMRGYNVIEVRQSDAMQIMHQSGEFGLSRETGILKDNQEVSALVVGTYAVSPVRVYLNTRVIDPRSSMVISAGTVEMRKSKEIARLLRMNSFPTAMERIPVRHLGHSVYPAPYYWPQYGYGVPQQQPWPEQQGGWEPEQEAWTLSEQANAQGADTPKPELPTAEDAAVDESATP